ncbi:MAG: GAF domain-containing protein [Chloroflexi bacterium]|nr:GAF domain-containing protein [Chloroflexota bacterium]
MNCHHIAIYLIDWGTHEVILDMMSTANEPSVKQGTRTPLASFQEITPTLLKNQLLINDLKDAPDWPPLLQTLSQQGVRSVCLLPLASQGNLIGAFNISSEHPGFFTDEIINLGQEVANQVTHSHHPEQPDRSIAP